MLSKTLKSESATLTLAPMDDFLEYVKQRKAALRKELTELEAAERVYRHSGIASGGATLPLPLTAPSSRPTIKEAVVQLLEEVSPMGLTALEILERLNRRWWRGELKRTSLSPQITRLKNDGKVVSERGTWKVAKKTAPEAVKPSGADDSEGSA